MNTFIALIKREVAEHNSLWRVPLVLLGIAFLVKLSFVFGNLSFDFDLASRLNLDASVESLLSTAVGKVLKETSDFIAFVMYVVAIFYALASLYDERQDQSVLFWRSLPISDTETILAKLVVALAVVPIVVVVLQSIVAVVCLGTQSSSYLGAYFSYSLGELGKTLLWSMLPIISWCLFCSQIAKKSPLMMALVIPLVVTVVDWLFLDGVIADTFVINRFTGVDHYTPTVLIVGLIFSAACLTATIAKRGERF